MEDKIILSKKQLKQAHVLRKYNEKLLGREEAAKALGMSERVSAHASCLKPAHDNRPFRKKMKK